MRVTFVLLLLLVLMISFSNSVNVAQAADQTNLVIGEVGAPSPSFSQIGLHAGQFIATTGTQIPYLYTGGISIQGTVVPGIANVPQVVPGTRSTQWVVNLRSPNMKWSDGVAIDSTDLAYSLGVFLPTGSYANLSQVDPWSHVGSAVKDITILNSTAIKVTTFNPDPQYPVLASLYQVYPYHYFKQYTKPNSLRDTPIVSGPGSSAYIIVNYTSGSRTFNMIANPSSPSWSFYGDRRPTIPRMTVQLFTSESALVNAIAAGTVDLAYIQPSDIGALNSASGVKIETVPSVDQFSVWLGTNSYPWNINAFRQAMMYLIPSQRINNVLYNGTLALGNPCWLLPAALPTYWPGPETPTYDYSTTEAVRLMNVAGLKQVGGQWQMANGTAVRVRITVDNGDPLEIRAAQFIQESMQSVGLQVDLQTTPPSSTAVIYHSGDFQMLVWDTFNTLNPTPYKFLANVRNYPNFLPQNTTAMNLINKALQDTDPVQSLQEIKQALLYVAKAAIGTTLVVLPYYVAYNSKTFTNWMPALKDAASYNSLYAPITAENVFTAIQPASPATTSQTTTSAAAPSYDYTTIVIVAAAVIVVSGVIYSRKLRRRTSS